MLPGRNSIPYGGIYTSVLLLNENNVGHYMTIEFTSTKFGHDEYHHQCEGYLTRIFVLKDVLLSVCWWFWLRELCILYQQMALS